MDYLFATAITKYTKLRASLVQIEKQLFADEVLIQKYTPDNEMTPELCYALGYFYETIANDDYASVYYYTLACKSTVHIDSLYRLTMLNIKKHMANVNGRRFSPSLEIEIQRDLDLLTGPTHNHIPALFTYAEYLESKGDIVGAIQYYKRSADDGANPEAMYRYAKYHTTTNLANMIEYYLRALDTDIHHIKTINALTDYYEQVNLTGNTDYDYDYDYELALCRTNASLCSKILNNDIITDRATRATLLSYHL